MSAKRKLTIKPTDRNVDIATLGPSKGHARNGKGFRWLKIRQPAVGAFVSVCYSMWMQGDLGRMMKGSQWNVWISDSAKREDVAELLREIRVRVRGHGRA